MVQEASQFHLCELNWAEAIWAKTFPGTHSFLLTF